MISFLRKKGELKMKDESINPEDHFRKPELPKKYESGKPNDQYRYGNVPSQRNEKKVDYFGTDFIKKLRDALEQEDPMKFMYATNMIASPGLDNRRRE